MSDAGGAFRPREEEKLKNLTIQIKSPLRVVPQRRLYGADTRIRTGDLILTKDALYLLSYISALLSVSHASTQEGYKHQQRGLFYQISGLFSSPFLKFFKFFFMFFPVEKESPLQKDIKNNILELYEAIRVG